MEEPVHTIEAGASNNDFLDKQHPKSVEKNTDCAELKPHKPNSTTGALLHANTNSGASVEADVKTKERGETGGLKEGQDCCWAPLHPAPTASLGLWRASGHNVLQLRGSQTNRAPPWMEAGQHQGVTSKCETKLCVCVGGGKRQHSPKRARCLLC